MAAFDGSIVASLDGHVLIPGCPRFGAAPELGVRLTAAAAAGTGHAWALTLRLAENTLRGLERAGLAVQAVDHASGTRGATDDYDWDTLSALRSAREREAVPDALIDTSGDFPGPAIVLLAHDSVELANKLDALAEGAMPTADR